MKLVLAMLAAVILWSGVASAAPAPTAAAAAPAPVSWDEQNRTMLYLIMDLSSINAINGINLTRDQAVRLRDLARQVLALSPRSPDLQAALRPDFSEVRDVYTETRTLLLAGKDVPDAVEKRVGQARRIETTVVRLSVASPAPTAQSCTRCHGLPAAADVRTGEDVGAVVDRPTPAGSSVRERFIAHSEGLLGRGGFALLAAMAPQVDAILTAEQKDVLGSFTCCLIPPKSMSDPVRAGQAAGGEKEIETLRWARSVPAENWPVAKGIALDRWKAGYLMKSPGADEDAKARVVDSAGRIYEKARGLSDTDFEMQKAALATEMHAIVYPAGKGPDDPMRKFSASLFLIGSGTVEAYDHLIQRLDAAAARSASR